MKTPEEKLLSGRRDMETYLRDNENPDGLAIVEVPESVDVKMIRNSQNLSQVDFAKRYGFPLGTVRNWEQGRRKPEGAARILLKIIKYNPDIVMHVLNEKHQDKKEPLPV